MTRNTTNATLDTVIIYSRYLARLADFYGRGLELGEPSATGDDHLGFQLPESYLGFDRADDPREHPGAVTLWFEVDDLDAAFDRFVALGAEVKFPPTKKPWGGILAAVFDPDGNVVGLAQRAKVPSDGGEGAG